MHGLAVGGVQLIRRNDNCRTVLVQDRSDEGSPTPLVRGILQRQPRDAAIPWSWDASDWRDQKWIDELCIWLANLMTIGRTTLENGFREGLQRLRRDREAAARTGKLIWDGYSFLPAQEPI